MSPCRCGHNGAGPHPCHADGYTCRKPAAQRFFDPYNGQARASLAGVQFKVSVSETWACEEHWQAFAAAMKTDREARATKGDER